MQGGLIHLQGDEQQPGFLARTSELTDLADLLPELEERIVAAQAGIQQLVAERAAVAETIHRAQEGTAALKQEQAGIRSRRDELAGRHHRLTENEENLQREQARRRMMQEVPKADVVITNPTHLAVALKYEGARMAAPKPSLAPPSLATSPEPAESDLPVCWEMNPPSTLAYAPLRRRPTALWVSSQSVSTPSRASQSGRVQVEVTPFVLACVTLTPISRAALKTTLSDLGLLQASSTATATG